MATKLPYKVNKQFKENARKHLFEQFSKQKSWVYENMQAANARALSLAGASEKESVKQNGERFFGAMDQYMKLKDEQLAYDSKVFAALLKQSQGIKLGFLERRLLKKDPQRSQKMAERLEKAETELSNVIGQGKEGLGEHSFGIGGSHCNKMAKLFTVAKLNPTEQALDHANDSFRACLAPTGYTPKGKQAFEKTAPEVKPETEWAKMAEDHSFDTDIQFMTNASAQEKRAEKSNEKTQLDLGLGSSTAQKQPRQTEEKNMWKVGVISKDAKQSAARESFAAASHEQREGYEEIDLNS